MPITLRDYLAHGLEMGLVVGPPAVVAVAFVLTLGWALARRMGSGGAAPVALAAAYLAAHFAVGGDWADALARPGTERLSVLALVALVVGLVEARLGGWCGPRATAGVVAARLAGAVAVAWAVVPPRLVGTERCGTSVVLVGGTLAATAVLAWSARRSDARAHLVALAPAPCALGGLAVQYGDVAILGQRAMGLGVGAAVLGGGALLLGRRGVAFPAVGTGAAAAVLGAGVLGATHLHGNLPLVPALLAYAAFLAPALVPGREGATRLRTAMAVVASLVLLGGAAAVAERERARAAELEGDELRSRAPADGGYDPGYGYGSEPDGSGSEADLPY